MVGGGGRGGWIDRRERVLGGVQGAQPGDDQQRHHQDDERQRGQHGRRPHAAHRKVALQGGGQHAHQDAHQRGDGHGAQHGPRRGGKGRHHQGGVVAELQLAVDGGQQHAGQSGHQARDHPGRGHHPTGIDAVELDEAPALHRTPHLQAQAGEPHQRHQGDEDQCRGHHGRDVDPVDRCAEDPEVDRVGVEEDAGRAVGVAAPEHDRQERRDPHEQADPGDQLGHGVGVGDPAEQQPVEDQSEEGRQHHHRDDEGQAHGQVLVLHQFGEGVGRDVGLGPVGEVEHAGGLVGEDQAHGHDGVGAPVGDPGDGEAEEVLHSPGRPLPVPVVEPDHAPGVPAGGVTGTGLLTLLPTQTNICLPLPNTGTNFFCDTWI